MAEFGKYFEIVSTLSDFDTTNIESAKEIFEHYKSISVIRDECEFEDDVWYTSDEYSNIGFHFQFSIGTYDKYYRDMFDMQLDDFVEYVKVFLCVMLGKVALHTLVSFLNDVKRLIKTPAPSISERDNGLNINTGSLVIDFLSVLGRDNDKVGDCAEALEYYTDSSYGKSFNQRTLADFESYFLFGDIMDDYWKSPISHKCRMFYYPLYLWWKLTGTYPQRPREFLLTPRDCLFQNEKGEYFMQIRNNNIKGKRKNKTVSYKINNDYRTDTIRIPDSLGLEIQNYISLTSEHVETDLDTLFTTDAHYEYFNLKRPKRTRFLTYMNMTTILRKFFEEIVSGVYGYKVIYSKAEGERLEDDEICYIHLGDTRHIAMINIIAEGGSIMTAMKLAGHSNPYTSGHYFTNISNLIQCKTYNEFRRLSDGRSSHSLKPVVPMMLKGAGVKLADNGYCYSKLYDKGAPTHCLQCIGPNGEIGYCPSCPYYRKKNVSFFSNDDIYLRNLEDECRELEKAVFQLNKGIAGPEDIGSRLMNIQASSISYENYLKEKIASED